MKVKASRFIAVILSVMLLISGFPIHNPYIVVNSAEGDPEPPPDTSYPTGIDSGRDFTIAWSDGRVAAWGNNSDHQCDVPVKLRGVTAASAGAEHALALKEDGTVVAWGDNEYGQCDVPAGLSNVIAVSAGGYHSLALKADGTVVAWGMNLNGQCNVPAVSNITAIAAGGYHSLALTADKTVVAWGYDDNGAWSTADLTDIIVIAAPWNHSLAIKSDGTVVAWGDNFGGQLDVPPGLDDVIAIAGSVTNSMALKADGTVVAWGGFYDVYTPAMFQPPVGLTQVTAISSEEKGCAVLKEDGTIASWGDTAGHLPGGSEIIPVPRIVDAQLAADNSYMDITVNESVYGQGYMPVSPSDFQVVFNRNGGEATGAGITNIQKLNGDTITTAENELRFLLAVEGEPTGEETLEIKPVSGLSVFDSFGSAMDAQESTESMHLNAVTAKILSAQMAPDNSHVDVTFNMGVYGDSGKTTAVAPDDFILTFSQNSGSASAAAIENLTGINGDSLVGGETALRFHLAVTGVCSGEETLEIRPAGDASIFASSGAAIPQSRSTAVIQVSPPVPALVSVEIAPDNTYVDVTFNTGVYGQSEFTDTGEEIGINGITQMNLQLLFNQNGGGYTGLTVTSYKNTAGEDLVGGEKTVRIYFDLEGNPTGEETVVARIEVVFNSAGQGGAQDTGDMVQLNGQTPGIGLAWLEPNNRYLDVNFSMGLYGDAGYSLPVTADDFQLVFAKNNGNTQNVTIKSVKKCDSSIENEASDLTGGENKIRFFLQLTDPAVGGEEKITIKPADAASIYGSEGLAMSVDESSDTIPLNPSRPGIVSVQLAEDNSFIDITFNFGVFGDSNHTTSLTSGHFHFSLHTAAATGIAVRSIKKPDSISEAEASPLNPAGGDTAVRVFLQITGIPNGEEYFNIVMGENPFYNSVGNTPPAGFLTDIIHLNDARLKINSAVLSEDNQYIDIFFNRGLYGDSAHSTPVNPEHFTLLFNAGSEGANSVVIRSVRKTTATNEDDPQGMPTGGETGLRFFLTVDGQPEGNETIEIKPSAVVGKEIYDASGNPLGTQPTTGAIVLHAPSPIIVSTHPGAGNAYLDITFNTGVYSDAAGTLPAVAGDFQLAFSQNDGAATGLSITSVRKNDGETEIAASALTGGEKTVRLFFHVAGTPDGNESYSIGPAGGAAIFSRTGGAMDVEQTTGTLELVSNMTPVVPEFVAASEPEIAGRLLQYMDVTFNTGIYGDNHHRTPAAPGGFTVTLTNNSMGGTNQVTIQAVTKPDSADPGVATPLAGGETVLRFFFLSPYLPNGEEMIVLGPVLNSVYSATGAAMPVDSKTAGRYLADPSPRIVSAQLDSGNKYIDVTFDRGMYGSGFNGEVYQSNFNLNFSKNGGTATDVLLSWAARPDSPLEDQASPLEGGETTIRLFLLVGGLPSGAETIEIKPSYGLHDEGELTPSQSATTRPIHLFSPCPPSWPGVSASGEQQGWMSDVYVSAGYDFTAVLKNNGTVTAFGDNSTGACGLPSGLSGVKAVSTGADFTLALSRDGILTAAGDITVPPGLNGVRAIDSGNFTAFALKNDGTVALIGNETFHIFNERNINETNLELPLGSASVSAISAGISDHLLILKSDGTVAAKDYSFTDQDYGQCTVPAGLNSVKAVSAGYNYSLALKTDGTVVGWGAVTLPQGGLSNAAAISAGAYGYAVLKTDGSAVLYGTDGVQKAAGNLDLTGIIAITAGFNHYAFIRRDGEVVVLADNTNEATLLQGMPENLNIFQNVLKGTLFRDNRVLYIDLELLDSPGEGANALGIYGPVGVPAALTASKLKATIVSGSGTLSGVSIKSISDPLDYYNPWIDGGETKIRAYLELTGFPSGGETIEIRPATSFSVFDASGGNLLSVQGTGPIALQMLDSEIYMKHAVKMDAGGNHSLALQTSGDAFAWGDNSYGQAPVPINQNNAAQVSAGYSHSVVLLRDGTVKVWGDNYYGQKDVPGDLKRVLQVSAGGYHTLTLNEDSTVSAWGHNHYGQCSVPQGLSGVIQVSGGGYHSLALKNDGTVVAWGDNAFGQCSVPQGLTNVVWVAAGEDYSVALKEDGSVIAWGDNTHGQITVPVGLTDVKAISTGSKHTLALRSNGQVAAWGLNDKHQCDIPAGLTGVVAIAAGTNHSLAMNEEGVITAWGSNTSGQCSVPEGILPPRIVSAEIAQDNSFVDIQFNKGVYGLSDGTGPVTAEDFTLIFNAAAEGAENVTIQSVKKNDSTGVANASALAGGENIIRIFLTVTGHASGSESVEINPGIIFDQYGAPIQSNQTTGALQLTYIPIYLEIAIDNQASQFGALEWTTFTDNSYNPPETWRAARPALEPMSVFEYDYRLNSGAGKNRMLLVGLYSSQTNHFSQELQSVQFDDVPMNFAGTAVHGDVKMDLYYLLDAELPDEPGLYYVKARYDGVNTHVGCNLISLCNVAQIGPENLVITTGNGDPDKAVGTTIATLTEKAMVVDFAGVFNRVLPDIQRTSGLTTQIVQTPGEVTTNWNTTASVWAEIIVSIRNAMHPVLPPEPTPTPTPRPEPVYPAGSSIAFESRDMGFTTVPMLVGEQVAAVGATQIRISADGETWGTPINHPEGDIFTAGGRFFNFQCENTTVTVSSSTDTVNWTGASCVLPPVTHDSATYHYENITSIRGVAAYKNPVTGEVTYVAVGNAWVAQKDDSGDVVYHTDGEQAWPYETAIKIILRSTDSGATWTASYLDDFVFNTEGYATSSSSPRYFEEVLCHNNGVFIAYDRQTVYYSMDLGESWAEALNFREDSQGNYRNPYYYRITGIYLRNNTLVMTGTGLDADNLNIFTSTDGVFWDVAEIAEKDPAFLIYDPILKKNTWQYGKDFQGVAYARNTYAAISGNTLATSTDGRNWSITWCDDASYTLEAANDRFYRSIQTKASGNWQYWLLSSDNLENWYFEMSDYRGAEMLNFDGKVYVSRRQERNIIDVGVAPLPIEMTSPRQGERMMPLNALLTVSFTDEIKAGTGYSGITLKNADGVTAAVTVNLDGANKTVEITPQAALQPLTEYTLTIPEGALKDNYGTKTNKLLNLVFTTGTMDAPIVTGTSLEGFPDGLPADAGIEINYSRAITAGPALQYDQIKIAPAGDPDHPITISKTIAGSKLVLNPALPLTHDASYTITIPYDAVRDLYGNEADAWSDNFTVAQDTVAPFVESTDPAHLERRVETGTPIRVTLSEVIQAGEEYDGITLKDTRLADAVAIDIELVTQQENGINKTVLTITPQNELPLYKTYRVTIPAEAIRDLAGNTMAAGVVFEFTEGIQPAGPALVSTSPTDQEQNTDLRGRIVLTYDRPVKTAPDFMPDYLKLYRWDTHGTVEFTWSIDGNRLLITPKVVPDDPYNYIPMQYGMKYEFRVGGGSICDQYGNVDQEERIIAFTTESQKVVSTSPAQDASDILLNGSVRVTFDETFCDAVKGSTFNNITLKRAESIQGQTTYVPAAMKVMLIEGSLFIIPEADMAPNTLYTVEIPRGAVQNSSIAVNNAYTLSFTTGNSSVPMQEFAMTHGLTVGDVPVEGEPISFDAEGCLTGATGYFWSFGDGSTAVGAKVTHAFTYRGDYNVMLMGISPNGAGTVIRKAIAVQKRPDAASVVLEVSPKAPVPLNPGGSTDYVLSLKALDKPIRNATIVITRTYPLSENKPPETLVTVTTDYNGNASYTAMLPQGVPEYYVTFTYTDVSNGIQVRKEVRRILKNAIGKVDISGYVKNDRNVVLSGAKVSVGPLSTQTDANGFYRITGLDAGTYSMRVSHDKHYDSVSTVSAAQKSIVVNASLTKLSPAGNPIIRQIFIDDTAAASGQNFYFLKGVDAVVEMSVLVDWNGHDTGYVEFIHGGTVYNEADMRLSFNAGNMQQGDKITVSCISADGVRSQSVDAGINIINGLPSQFHGAVQPTFAGGKYVLYGAMSLAAINTPAISSIPLLKGGPIGFLNEPAMIVGAMNLDGTFQAFIGRSTSASAYGYYSQNNLLQKYYAKSKAVTEAQKAEISSRQSRSWLGSVEMNSNLDASFFWHYSAYKGEWVYDEGSLKLGLDSRVYGKSSWGIPSTPLSVYLSGEFDLLMEAFLRAYYYNSQMGYDLGTLDFKKIRIEIAGGLDAYIASASVHFSGEGKVKIDYQKAKTNYFIEVKGWVNVRALAWDLDLPFLSYSWGDNSPWASGNPFMKALSDRPMLASTGGANGTWFVLPKTEEFRPMNRDYLETQSDWYDAGSIVSKSSGRLLPSASDMAFREAIPARASGIIPNESLLASASNMIQGEPPLSPVSGLASKKIPLTAASGITSKEPLLYALSEEAPEDAATVLRSNTFPHTDHRILSYPGGAFMVLVEDDPTRSAANRTRLKYSIYDGSAWSAPAAVDPGDATADYKPVAAATSDGVIAAWENVKGVLAEDAALEEALAAEEICTGRYDEASNTWVDVANLTDDSYMDCSPQIAASGNKAVLVWLKSKSQDYSNLLTEDYSAVNDICFSQWEDNAFSIPMAIASFDRPVMDLTAAYHGNGAIILFTVDEDKNLNTAEDQEIYRMAYDGTEWTEPVKLTNNQVKDSNGQISYLDDEAIAVWNQNGKLLYTTDPLSASPMVKTALEQTLLQDTFTMIADGEGTLALVGPGKSGNAQELYAVTYEKAGDVWSCEIALTTDQAINRNPSAAFVGNRLVSVYNRAQITTAVNPEDGTTYPSVSKTADLVMAELALTHNLAVSAEGIILSDGNPQPGSIVTLSAEIMNIGSYAETGMTTVFYHGNPDLGGANIGQASPTGTLAPGMSAIASVQWEVPSQNVTDTIYVVVSPRSGVSDSDPADNKAFIHIQRPDLELSALECTPAGNGKYAITVRAANIGTADVQNALVTLYYGGLDDELVIIGTIDAGELKAGEIIELPYLWSPSATVFQEGRANLFATIDIPSGDNGIMLAMEVNDASDETTLENNVRMVTVNQQYLGILNYSPANLQENVNIGQPVTITFNNNLSQQINPGLTLTGPGSTAAGVVTAVNGDTLVITPTQQLQYSTEYTLTLPKDTVTDVNGRVMEEPWSITFTTESTAVIPLLQSLNNAAVNGAIKLPFSAGILQGVNFNGMVLRNNALQNVPCTFACSGNILEIKPNAPLAYTSSYTVVIPAGALKNTSSADLSAFTFILNTQGENDASLKAGLSQLTLSLGTLKPAFNKDTDNYQVEVGSNTGTISITPAALDETMVITVDGSAVASGHASQLISLETGNNVITIDVTTADGKNVKTYTIVINRAPSDDSPGSGTGSGKTASINAGAYNMNIQVSANKGITTASLSSYSLNAAFEKAAKDSDGISTVNIQMPEAAGSTGYEVKLPVKVLTSDRVDQKLSMTSPAGILILPVNMLNGVSLKGATNVEISMGQVDSAQLPENVRKLIGARPVIELKLTSGANTLEWSNPNAPVTVSIPYTPTAEELKDPEHITIWYIDGKGNVQSVPTGRYDPQTGRVTFTTTHFSYYAAAFTMKTFRDLDKAVWARKPVEVLASKGILEGKSEAEYDPMTEITRANFLCYLVRALGVDAKFEDNFEDIKPDARYYQEIGIAKKLGITTGTGNNLFKPEESITRQDMIVLTVRALRLLNRLKQEGAAKDLDGFTDKSLVADYAVDAVATAVSEGLIIGNGGKVNPGGNTNRAEAAMFLYRIYNRY